MGKWCLHASSFIFDRITIRVAGNQDRHKSLVEFDFSDHSFWSYLPLSDENFTLSNLNISVRPVDQSWSNVMCSIIGVGERLHKVLGENWRKLSFNYHKIPFLSGLLTPYIFFLLSLKIKAWKQNLMILNKFLLWNVRFQYIFSTKHCRLEIQFSASSVSFSMQPQTQDSESSNTLNGFLVTIKSEKIWPPKTISIIIPKFEQCG